MFSQSISFEVISCPKYSSCDVNPFRRLTGKKYLFKDFRNHKVLLNLMTILNVIITHFKDDFRYGVSVDAFRDTTFSTKSGAHVYD